MIITFTLDHKIIPDPLQESSHKGSSVFNSQSIWDPAEPLGAIECGFDVTIGWRVFASVFVEMRTARTGMFGVCKVHI